MYIEWGRWGVGGVYGGGVGVGVWSGVLFSFSLYYFNQLLHSEAR